MVPGMGRGTVKAIPPRLRIVHSVTAGIAVWVVGSAAFGGSGNGEELRVVRSRRTGLATHVVSMTPDGIAVRGTAAGAVARPIDFLSEHGGWFGVADAQAELVMRGERTDALGQTHSTFDQVFQTVPVLSGVLVVHQDSAGRFIGANGHFHSIKPTLSAVPTLGADDATAFAASKSNSIDAGVESSGLVIVDPGWYGDPAIGAHLAYFIIRSDPSVAYREAFLVDAHTGNVLDRWSLVESAMDRRIYDGQGGAALPGVLVREEGGSPVAGLSDANATYDYAGDSYGYYLRAFGRDSLDGLGLPLIATVRSTAAVCPNAFWNGMQTAFCFGTASDDIVAHEFQHGVTQSTANLIYQNQPGQINEGYSDIFGELIDLFNGNAAFAGTPSGPPYWPTSPTGPGTDAANGKRTSVCSQSPSYVDGVRWLIGEDAGAFSTAIRDMWNPPCRNHPDRANSMLQTCDEFDNGGVHSGSGVVNHAFAMMTDGQYFNGHSVAGIGPIKAGAVWFRALTTYLTVASDFEDLYTALNLAAADLVGAFPDDPRTGLPSNGLFTQADAVQVNEALLAVEMNTEGRCGAAIALLNSAPPHACPGAEVFFADDFESGVNGWTVVTSGPSGPPTPYAWVQKSGPLPLGRTGTVWYCADPTLGNCTSQNESAVHSLISPAIQAPANVIFPRLSFAHYMAAEPTVDGGNVRISVNGGAWQLIPFDRFEYNSYSAFLLPSVLGNTNPLAGQPGWTGAGGGWGTTVVDLGGFLSGGETLRVRFDFGKDGCNGVDGWYVDDVVLYSCPDCDGSGLPDNLDYVRTYVSGALGPMGSTAPQSATIPHTARATGDVTLDFRASADLGANTEFIDVDINGVSIGRLFEIGASECPMAPNAAALVVPAPMFNVAIGGGDAVIHMIPSADVAVASCGNGYINVAVRYNAVFTDTNGNGVIDACEDCQPNGIPDPAEIQAGTAADCNGNLKPDECDIAAGTSADLNLNGIPDECECSVPAAPSAEIYAGCPGECYATKGRYLSIVPPPVPVRATGVALRVRLGPMPGPNNCPKVPDYSAYDGVDMWVGAEVLHGGAQPSGVYELQPTPLFRDWTGVSGGVVQVTDCNIVPCAAYAIDAISDYCSPFFAPAFSPTLVLRTSSVWGDIVGGVESEPPNGVVEFVDISGMVDRFKNALGAPPATWCDVGGNRPSDGLNFSINFYDIAAVVDAFKGAEYPFGGPTAPDPCTGTP